MLPTKKTLLITIDFPPQLGGVANYLSNFSNNIQSDKIIILANQHTQAQSFDSQQNYKIIRRNLYYKNFWPKWFKIFFIARKIIKQEKIEQIIISHVLPIGYLALLLSKPFFTILHGYDILLAKKTIWHKFWLKLILKKSQHIIVNSNFTKKQVIKQGIGEQKITILYPCPHITPKLLNTTEKDLICQELNLNNKIVLLSVGRMVKRKGFDMVIKALPEIIQKYPNLIYIIIGQGPDKDRLDQLAIDLKVRANLIFITDITDQQIACYYDRADIFIMPSRLENKTDVEGFGIVYLEANSFGKPVIAGDSGGVGDAVLNNKTGILVNPKENKDITQAIFKLLDDENLMNKLGEQGKKRVLNEFQWSKQVNKLNNIL